MYQAVLNAEFDFDAAQPVVASVPHINIRAFCGDERTLQSVQAAATDRRMSRAHVQMHMGGIAAAVQVFQSELTPNVLIVETAGSRETVLTELAQLAQVCGPETKVIVIGHLNDVLLYRELMRQGVSEYLVAPVHQLQLIEAIAALFHDPKAKPLGRIFAFVGSKGGVGSSMLAHNIGWYLSRHLDTDTIITDFDLAFGTAGLNFNQDASQGIADALGQPDRVDQTLLDRLLTKCGDKLSLLASPGAIDRDVHIDTTAVETILNTVRHSVPCVIVDVPNMWAPWIKLTLLQADEVVITATPELASLRNAKNLVDLLKQARPNDRPPRLVMNQVGVPKRPEIPVADFAKAIGLEPALIIAYDAQTFGTAASNGQMLAEVSAKAKAAEAVANLAQMLIGQEKPKPSKFSLTFASKLLRKK
ncbi:CtpF protein [Nordella sp. HKS 07]|uniref:AAA family ATPase n=1 Tax=Nordella sp. HKS 07 TaxID=2712222 RepID=UPI0013E1B2F4|nr:CtpF protein [Nordella sp. HKS 07]QIG48836.1 CtpF protein [Nordella sp. HKS 07]